MQPYCKFLLSFSLIPIVAVVLTWPLAPEISNHIIAIPHDGLDSLWRIWAYQYAQSHDLDTSAFIFSKWPTGISLHSQYAMYTADAQLRLGSASYSNPVTAYNAVFFAKLVLWSWGIVALLRTLGCQWWVATLGGILAMVSPSVTALYKAYGVLFIPSLLPWVTLSFWLFWTKRCWSHLTLATLMSCLFIGENFYYTYFLACTMTLWILTLLGKIAITHPRALLIHKKTLLLSALLTTATASTLFYFFYAPRNFSIEDIAIKSINPIFFFIPPLDHNLFSDSFDSIYHSYWGLDYFERCSYLGISSLVLILWAQLTKTIPTRNTHPRRFCLQLMIVAMVLGTGPIWWQSLPAPAYFFAKAAPMFRFYSRYSVIIHFFLIILVGLSLQLLWDKNRNSTRIRCLLAALPLATIAEFNSLRPSHQMDVSAQTPSAYHFLGALDGSEPILETPMQNQRLRIHSQLFQLSHQRPVSTSPNKAPSYHFFNHHHQKSAFDAGFRYWVVLKKTPPIAKMPYSQPINASPWSWFYPQPRIGYLELIEDWPDSSLYRITDSWDSSKVYLTAAAGTAHKPDGNIEILPGETAGELHMHKSDGNPKITLWAGTQSPNTTVTLWVPGHPEITKHLTKGLNPISLPKLPEAAGVYPIKVMTTATLSVATRQQGKR